MIHNEQYQGVILMAEYSLTIKKHTVKTYLALYDTGCLTQDALVDTIATLQADKTNKDWVEWLESKCDCHPFYVSGHAHYHRRRLCPDCWQERKKLLICKKC
jgi:hypothetical protein